MDYGVEIVHQNPFGIARPLRMRRHSAHFFFYFFVNAVRDSLDVRVGITFADNEKICGSITEFPKVELHNIFAFFIPNTFDDKVVELFGVCGVAKLFANLCPPGWCCGCNQVC